MFRRLRTKLVVACLGLWIATVIPVALIPYYIQESEERKKGEEHLQIAEANLGVINEQTTANLNQLAKTLRQFTLDRLNTGRYDRKAFETDDDEALQEIQLEAGRQYADSLRGSIRFAIRGQKWYADLSQKLAEVPGFLDTGIGGERQLSSWAHEKIVSDGLTIGVVVVMKPSIVSEPPIFPGNESASNSSAAAESSTPPRFVHKWPKDRFPGVDVSIASMENEEFRAKLDAQPEFKEAILTKRRIVANEAITNGEKVRAIFYPFRNHRGELTGVVILSVPRLGSLFSHTQNYTAWALGLSALLAVLLGAVVARSIAAPVNRLAKTSKKMAAGELTARVEVTGSDEISVLSASFNDMADTVEANHTELAKRATDLQESNRLLESANHELNRTREFLENILANIRTGVMALDIGGRVVRLNRAAAEILNCPRSNEERDYHDLLGRATFAQLVESTLHKGVSIFQREVKHTTGAEEIVPLQVSTVPLLDEGRLTGMVVTFHDLSSVRRLEEQLVRQDRLAALGRLSAGVAHEIRNPLGIMKGSAELLKRRFGGLPGEEGLTDFILEEIGRLSRVVSDFLNFARPPAPALQRLEVNDIVHRATQFLEHQDIPAPIEYHYELAENLPSVELDSNMFQQVMLNLLLNAQESMPGGGRITIRTYLTRSAELAIEITDQGCGMDSTTIDRIFDPFFSSKESGSGLGLSVVHQIVAGHGGRIEVDSQPGEGSTLRVTLPTATEELPKAIPAAS